MEKINKKTKKETAEQPKTEPTLKKTKEKKLKKETAEGISDKISTPVVAETPPADEFGEEAFEAAREGEAEEKSERYWEAVGRRKTAIARVRLFTRGDKIIMINGKPHGEYFFSKEAQKIAEDSLQKMKSMSRFRVSVKVSGGGLKAQAEATRHGIARALVEFNPDFRKRLRRAGYLTRDPRMKERKKFGLKSARRRPQWAKR